MRRGAHVEDLDEGRHAVGGARGVGHDGVLVLVVLVVDAHDEGGDVALAWRRDDHLLRARLHIWLHRIRICARSHLVAAFVTADATALPRAAMHKLAWQPALQLLRGTAIMIVRCLAACATALRNTGASAGRTP